MKRSQAFMMVAAPAIIGVYFWMQNPSDPTLPQTVSPGAMEAQILTGAGPVSGAPIPSASKGVNDSDRQSDEIISLSAGLREKYGALIGSPKIQVHVLEKMMNLLKSLYGDAWPEHMEEVIRLTFPDVADVLLPRLQSLMAYYDWAQEARFDLAAMSDLDRRQAMWEQRKALFGEDAMIIWQGQLRTEQMQDVVTQLNDATSMPLAEKMDTYFTQLHEIYQEDAPKAISHHRQEVMDHFLTVGSVQQDLHNLSVEARHQHLRQLREQVGLDEAALNRWDQLDTERDQRWQKGIDYMRQRNALASSLTGTALDEKLQSLQNNVFGEEAEIIRNEEASGYFRYEGQQQYGVN